VQQLREDFKNPTSEFRGKPFWAWNGKLEEQEMRRQIRIMQRMGLGGFFMHSRVGLDTPYLSDEWFRLVRACCDEAKKLGMEAWLYDEDRWPSGAGGGIVTKDPRYRQHRLQMDVLLPEKFRWSDDYISVFTARVDGPNAYDVKSLSQGQMPPAQDDNIKVLTFRVITVQPSPWFNDQTYLDTLSHEAVQKFIEVTHERYQQTVGEFFGNIIPGIFTDEPNHGTTCDQELMTNPANQATGILSSWIPWTPKLPETFQSRYGYDLLDHLPAVFFDIDGQEVQQPRHHYHDCKTFLFTDAFARQIGQWCQAHNLMFTGHVLFESPLSNQMSLVGSAMRFYEHMQAPGIDILTECHGTNNMRKEYDTAKQCSSVQRQCGRRWLLSELYGCTGWDFSFEGHKAVGDWQAALGVNLRCQHLSWYTMQGQAKRDYPASIFYQSPWYEQYSTVEDYFARVTAVMSCGTAARDLLVVHPMESAWQMAKAGWIRSMSEEWLHKPTQFDNQFMDLRDWLLEAHIDFDYGDEEMLSRLGSVRQTDNGPELAVGDAIYKTMLIPPLLTIRRSTVDLAQKFLAAGGQVVMAGKPAEYVDALADDTAVQLAKRCKRARFRRSDVVKAAEPARILSITNARQKEEPAILYLCQVEDGNSYLFLCNTDRKKPCPDITLRVKLNEGSAAPQEWDPTTGDVFTADWQRDGQEALIKTSFAPSGSRLFVLPAQQHTQQPAKRPQYQLSLAEKPMLGRWEYSLSEPNVLVLDKATFRIDNGPWQPSTEVLKIDRAIRDALGINYRGGTMVQPWARPKNHDQKTIPVELQFEFSIAQLPEAAIELAIEQPHRFRIRINGHPIHHDDDCGWWTDLSIRRLPIQPGYLRQGKNQLSLSIDYTADDGIEAAFLLGHFGVTITDDSPAITKIPATLRIGNWVKQGLPFYGGSVTYHRSVSPAPLNGRCAILELPAFGGACVRVLINGQPITTLGWPPYEVDLTDAIDNAEVCELGIEVFAHRRNAFGPLHQSGAGSRPGWVGPEEFQTNADKWQDSYSLVPCGLLKGPILRYVTQV